MFGLVHFFQYHATMSSHAPLESIRLCILLAVAKESMRGADIQNQITADAKGMIYISDSTLYKTLNELKRRGYLQATENGKYSLEESGKHLLKRETNRLWEAVRLAQTRTRQY
jgi:DNA-binding PadR family transcriptional regulator